MDDLFLRACRREPVERTPVWFMRQAGRYQPEYRALRERHGILEICRTPSLAGQVTVLPVEQLGVDAAILFSDIMVPVAGMGAALQIVEGRGPVIDPPVRSAADLDRLHVLDPEADVPFVGDAVRECVERLEVPLIGFAGAPFTLASYVVAGRGSRDAAGIKALIREAPATADALMARLADMTAAYLRAQVEAGVQAVQLFDSWAGALSPYDYRRSVAPHVRRIFDEVGRLGVPTISFSTGTAGSLADVGAAGGDVIGVDWRIGLDDAWRAVPDRAIQGNLDPDVLLGPWDTIRGAADWVLDEAGGRDGHIFNLGHGVLPATNPDVLARLVDRVHERGVRRAVA